MGDNDSGVDESQSVATQQPSADGDSSADDDSSGDTDATDDAPDQLIANSDAHNEVTTASGGRVVVGVDREAQTGGTIVSVGSIGVPEGICEGDFEPAAGGSLTLQVLADGQGLGAGQTTLDEAATRSPSPTSTAASSSPMPGCAP